MHFTIEADLVYVRKQKDQLKSEKAESYFYFLEIRKNGKKRKLFLFWEDLVKGVLWEILIYLKTCFSHDRKITIPHGENLNGKDLKLNINKKLSPFIDQNSEDMKNKGQKKKKKIKNQKLTSLFLDWWRFLAIKILKKCLI